MSIDLAWLQKEFPDLKSLAALSIGGQKIVVACDHPTDGKVVLKLINPAQDPEMAAREMIAVNALNCSRVPNILDNGIINSPVGPLVWVREVRVGGTTLQERLKSGPLPSASVLILGLDILEILARAEELRIVHRDVKPANIMAPSDTEFWLLDFGIARHLDLPSLTDSARRWGKMTVGYAPPEQCRNVQREIDSRSDLFALGVTLYEAATGVNPFVAGARDQHEILRRVETEALPPLLLGIPKRQEFAGLVSAMVQKRRDHRPTTAADALAWLREITKA